MSQITSEQYVAGLRELADFYEANPDMVRPHPYIWVHCWSREDFIKAAVGLAKGGRVSKSVDNETDIAPQYHAKRFFGEIEVDVCIDRKTVCRLVRPAVYDCPDSLLEEAAEYAESE